MSPEQELVLDLAVTVVTLPLGGNVIGTLRGARVARGMGDLTVREVKAIQSVVNQAGRPLEVVGSAARGASEGKVPDMPFVTFEGRSSSTNTKTVC
jgi:hypothetical protein